jgi:thiamine-monophosphate kinase
MKKLSDIGEREAIRIISKILSKGDTALGDDCATLDMDEEHYLLVSTDMILQQTHIPQEMTPYEMGWFIVAVNLSDIASKGGIPIGVLLSLGLPREISEKFLKDLTKGADACAAEFGTYIVGGDTKEANEVTLCGTALGIVKKDEFMPRQGAKPGDTIAVTGELGKAGAGLLNLKNKILDKDLSKFLLQPIPRLKEGRVLAGQKCVTSCMDISDGLSSSLYQLKELNKTGFEIDLKNLPISSDLIAMGEKHSNLDVCSVALHFGGDYELLLTIPPEKFKQTREIMRENDLELIDVGRVIEDEKVILVENGRKKILENKGYEHFKKPFSSILPNLN